MLSTVMCVGQIQPAEIAQHSDSLSHLLSSLPSRRATAQRKTDRPVAERHLEVCTVHQQYWVFCNVSCNLVAMVMDYVRVGPTITHTHPFSSSTNIFE